jgi:hypothetical protein
MNTLSVVLSEGLDEEDMNVLGGLLSAVGDSISLFASLGDSDERKSKPMLLT